MSVFGNLGTTSYEADKTADRKADKADSFGKSVGFGCRPNPTKPTNTFRYVGLSGDDPGQKKMASPEKPLDRSAWGGYNTGIGTGWPDRVGRNRTMANFRFFADMADGSTLMSKRADYDLGSKKMPRIWDETTRTWLRATRIVIRKNAPSMHECDARCMNATGRTMQCECSCGGKNHGKGSALVCLAA